MTKLTPPKNLRVIEHTCNNCRYLDEETDECKRPDGPDFSLRGRNASDWVCDDWQAYEYVHTPDPKVTQVKTGRVVYDEAIPSYSARHPKPGKMIMTEDTGVDEKGQRWQFDTVRITNPDGAIHRTIQCGFKRML